MYGLIGKMIAAAGQRDALIEIILEGADAMPGCISYIVAKDAANPDAIWITEVWESKASHEAALALPGVQASIQKAMPLIVGFESSVESEPVGETFMHGQRERQSEWQRGNSWVGGRTRSGRRNSSCVGVRRVPEAALLI